jgi:hypothetical protein
MTIEPETKSWTWVLERECPECGFDTRAFAAGDIANRLRDAAAPWPGFLADPSAGVRPQEDTWSALEYGCHVRDVYRMGSYRLGRMLAEDDPRFANWDQDEAAIAERYDLQDPGQVTEELTAAATGLADLYDTVGGDQWQRPGMRSDGSPFTVDSFGRYVLHDLVHHLVDVRHGYESLHGAP